MVSSFRRCNKRIKLCHKDWISSLPDDILVDVLSFLTTKEAGRTSVLSKRWKQVWAHVPLVIFDASDILARCDSDYTTYKPETVKYLSCVDHVVSSHKALVVDEMRLRFFLTADSKYSIDKWVRFASEKRVKILELNFGCYIGCLGLHPYNFPSLIWSNSLTYFKLDFVYVTSEVLESIINNCKALEVLSVTHSHDVGLVALKVVSLSLKSLRIPYCFKLEKLEIDAPNLVSLEYSGWEMCMPFKNTPNLVEISITGEACVSHLASPIFHHIKMLKLDTLDIQAVSKAFPQCTRLKTLHLVYEPEREEDLFHAITLIKACPFLHKLVIQRLYMSDSSKYRKTNKWDAKEEETWCHYNLKIVEIVGFAFSELRFARYLIEKACSLEKLTIDTQPALDLRTPGQLARARKKAKELRKELKPWTELEIR